MTCTHSYARRFATLILCVSLITSLGCAGFSQLHYGPESADKVREGDTVHQAITNYGKPDYIHDTKGDQLYVWRSVTGMSVLGLYHNLQKADLVVEIRDQTVQKVHWVPLGQGNAFVGVVALSTDKLP